MVKSLHTRGILGEKSRGVVFASYPWSSFWPPTVGCCIYVEAAVEHICARGPGATTFFLSRLGLRFLDVIHARAFVRYWQLQHGGLLAFFQKR
jgi:hypothetical protein